LTLTRRVAALLLAVWLLAGAGAAAFCLGLARAAFSAQVAAYNDLAARQLAVLLAPQATEEAALHESLARLVDAGDYRRIELRAPGGRVLREHRAAPSGGTHAGGGAGAPLWFVAALDLRPAAGRAPLPGNAGELVVETDSTAAQAALWRGAQNIVLVQLALAALSALLAWWTLRGWWRPLKASVAQAQAIGQARFVTAEEPALPELREVTRAMNSMVRRLRELFQAQAEQVAQLQQQAQTDVVSGLPLREQFVGRLVDLLADAGGPPVALLIVRVPNLDLLNERHGREATDRLLAALADVLLTYVERVSGACAGRLNGTDFALGLPAAGIALETAQSLRGALEATPAARLAGAEFLFGGIDGLRGLNASAALAAADAALARAESGAEGIAIDDHPETQASGSRAWRDQIALALEQGRVQLGAYPVVDARGHLIHLECPLRVQLQPGGEFLVARRWLAMAARSRLLPQVDLAAVDLALAAIEVDGRPRCVHVAPRSFADPDFTARLQAQLGAAPQSARWLSIEWTEAARSADTAPLRAAIAGWRHLGVTVGVEHAGASAKALPALKELGVDYVKVDGRHLRGIADDEAVRGYAQSLVALLHGLGLTALAEGIDEPRDLLAAWAIGFDGATGAAVPPPTD
jgi:EAL domain-containing protein (putative c-di-GMP-specific phosphodiesterase class I)/GGDEF domain-containing protein